MPARLFVCTPTKLAAYADCPRRYRYSYVDRPAPPKGPPWAHTSLGASLHIALRNWYALPAERRRPEVVATLLKGGWVRDGYRDPQQEEAAFRAARGWLEAYVATQASRPEPIGVERVVAVKTSVLALSGRVDRIDVRRGPQGPELVIVDYKTGRAGLDSDDARGSQALALYAYAAERVFRRPCRRVELHHLPTGAVAAHEHTAESIERHVRRAEAIAGDIVAAERAVAEGADPDAAFPATPSGLCSWCEYRQHCPEGAAAPVKEPWAAVDRLLADQPAEQAADSAGQPRVPRPASATPAVSGVTGAADER
ncbi:MAG: recombinase RecB [Actinobacteria bacterium]|nr:MAG: recombinase RecB [Actinomycetota bacterium]